MNHENTKNQLHSILVRVNDWYVFPARVREDYYPDFNEAIAELVSEGKAERTNVEDRVYFRRTVP